MSGQASGEAKFGAENGSDRLEALFDHLADEAGEGERISMDEILDALAHRSFGPLLLVPSLIAIFPVIGALPGVSYAMAFLVFFIAVQAALSKPKLWLPGRLKRMSFKRETFKRGVDKARPVLRWIDGFIVKRFAVALRSPFPEVIVWLCVALGALMLVYAAVPGGVVIPGLALVLLSLGLTTHDGLIVTLGLVAGVAAVAGSAWLVMQLFQL